MLTREFVFDSPLTLTELVRRFRREFFHGRPSAAPAGNWFHGRADDTGFEVADRGFWVVARGTFEAGHLTRVRAAVGPDFREYRPLAVWLPLVLGVAVLVARRLNRDVGLTGWDWGLLALLAGIALAAGYAYGVIGSAWWARRFSRRLRRLCEADAPRPEGQPS